MANDPHTDNIDSVSPDELKKAINMLRERLGGRLLGDVCDAEFPGALARYLIGRASPPLLFTPDRLEVLARRAAEHDPEAHAWEMRIADETRAGRWHAATHPHGDRFVSLEADFEFHSHPHPDPQTIFGLCRMRWVASLARAYWFTRDSSYLAALMREWDFFSKRVAGPDASVIETVHAIGPTGMSPPFAELDCFIRLTHWYWGFWLSVYAPEVDAERIVVLLARCLRLFDLVASRGVNVQEHNFTSMQMVSLYLWATALPEWVGMNIWQHLARNCLEASLRRAVLPDGVQWEKSASYHMGCIGWYGTGYLLGRKTNVDWAPHYGQSLRRMGEFADAIIAPDGSVPLMSDSDQKQTWREALSLLRCCFPDVRFRHPVSPTYSSIWMSDGDIWEPETVDKPAVQVFPDGGVACVRHDTDRLLIVDNGPTCAGHAHLNNLTLHWYSLGVPVLIDPGRWMYRPDADRAWVRSPNAHNTVVIEDEPVGPDDWIKAMAFYHIGLDDHRTGPFTTRCNDDYDIITTAFSGYVVDPTAKVIRTVLAGRQHSSPWLLIIDDIASQVEHVWTQSFLLPTDKPMSRDHGLLTTELANNVCLSILPAAATEVLDQAKFWCPNYGEKLPARWLRMRGPAVATRRIVLMAVAHNYPPRLRAIQDGSTISWSVEEHSWSVDLTP